MSQVYWTARALSDLSAITDRIALDAPKAAEIFQERLFLATEALETFPFSGRIVPEHAISSLREIIHGNYRIVYLVLPDGDVDILTVHHGAWPL